jgi:hypothetical protein
MAQIIKLCSAQRANRVRLQQAFGGSFDASPAMDVNSGGKRS